MRGRRGARGPGARRGGAWPLACALALVAALGACGGLPPLEDGRSTAYRPGLPDFDLDARVVALAPGAEVEALVSIPRASLVFTSAGEGYAAIARTALRLLDADGEPLASPSRLDTVRVASFAETGALAPLVVRQRLPAVTGALVLEAEVEDEKTGRVALRRLAVTVPAPKARLALGMPRLAVRDPASGAVQPLLALAVPAGHDSLRARVDVFGAGGPVIVRADLLRLRSDTTVAEPPSAFTPSPGSLRARGVDVRRPEPVATAEVRVAAPADVLTAEVPLPGLPPGVYRLRMEAAGGSGGPLAESERTFVVRPPGFPRLVGMGALVGPLAYLATPREMAALRERSMGGPDSARAAFDAFWGSLFQDRRRAAATLRAYYERVEEANRLFSAHTEGWKTDRGMVYVLFGPPERAEDRFNSEVWTYGGQTGAVFVFERTARRDRTRDPFDVWTLTRDRAYDATWRRALRLWRSGSPP